MSCKHLFAAILVKSHLERNELRPVTHMPINIGEVRQLTYTTHGSG